MSEDPDYYPLQPLATTAIRQFLAFLYVAATGLALLATAALPLLSPRVAARAEAAVV
ncbi:MAG: hypothetical protein HUU35_10485, partial [Armatimonadetes bacterium]|nr:hypothetical protein [Armatimonadota bacterium]